MKAVHLAFALLLTSGIPAPAQDTSDGQSADQSLGGNVSSNAGGRRLGEVAAGGGFNSGGGGGKPDFVRIQNTILQLQSRLIQLDPTVSGGVSGTQLNAGTEEASSTGVLFDKHDYCAVLTLAENAKECRTCWSYLDGEAGGVDCQSRIGGEVRYGLCSAPENQVHCP